MKVRVKEGQKGFIYGSLRREGQEITLKSVKGIGHDGKPATYSVSDQFSDEWMEKVDGRKKSAKPVEDLDE